MNGYQRSQWDPVLDPAGDALQREIRRSELCAPGRPDTVGHSSIQAWSAGELFPAVIARVEIYRERAHHEAAAGGALDSLAMRRMATFWELTLDGRSKRFESYDAAADCARALLADPWDRYGLRHQWRATHLASVAVSLAARVPDAMGVI